MYPTSTNASNKSLLTLDQRINNEDEQINNKDKLNYLNSFRQQIRRLEIFQPTLGILGLLIAVNSTVTSTNSTSVSSTFFNVWSDVVVLLVVLLKSIVNKLLQFHIVTT